MNAGRDPETGIEQMPDERRYRTGTARIETGDAAGPAFVNRVDEMAILDRELDLVAGGNPRVVLVTGPPGVGKTTLVEAFLAGHPSLVNVAASGAEAEISIDFGVMAQLAEVLAVRSGLMRHELSAAPMDPLSWGARLLELLGPLTDSTPCLLHLDDLHWTDVPSIEALAFALRRLTADRVLTVLACRDDFPVPDSITRLTSGRRGSRLRVGGLDIRAVQALAAAHSGARVSYEQAVALQAHTAGNPLYVQALLEELPGGVVVDPTGQLPAPHSYAAVVLAALARAPEPTRRLVAAASVLGRECSLADAAQMAGTAEPVATAEAAPAHVLELVQGSDSWRLRFTHPLNRASVYYDIRPSERSRLHRAAATVTSGRAAVRHRAQAAQGFDTSLAGELQQLGFQELMTGRMVMGAADLEAAARVHPDANVRTRLVLDAADALLWAGDIKGGTRLLAASEASGDPRAGYVEGHLLHLTGHAQRAQSMLRESWQRLGPADIDVRGPLSTLLANISITNGRGSIAANWAELAEQSLPPSHPLRQIARSFGALGHGLAGRGEEGLAQLGDLPVDPARIDPGDASVLAVRGILRLWVDEVQDAKADLDSAIAIGRSTGLPYWVMVHTSHLADAERRLGLWDDAAVHAELAVSLMEDTEQEWGRAPSHGFAALVPAARGEWSLAEEHCQIARTAAAAIGDDMSWTYAANAAVHLGFARQDWDAVIAAAGPLYELSDRGGAFEPAVVEWRELYTEALVAAGRLDDAEHELQEATNVALSRGRRSTLGRLARPRAALEEARANHEAAKTILDEGLEHARKGLNPFDRALLDDALGRHARRHGRVRDAVNHLEEALTTYIALRAAPFAERCQSELAACGRRATARPSVPLQLSPQEYAVAKLVVEGFTNREVARQLVLSVKTIEYHLRNVFNKLDVNSRTQLAARLLREGSLNT